MDESLYDLEQLLTRNGASAYLNYLLQFYRNQIARGEIRVILAPIDAALQRLVDRSEKSLAEIMALPEGRDVLNNFLSVIMLNNTKPIYVAINGSTYGNNTAELQTNLKMKVSRRIGNIDVAVIDGIINMPGQLDRLKLAPRPQQTPIQIQQFSSPQQSIQRLNPVQIYQSVPMQVQSSKSPRIPVTVQNLAVIPTRTAGVQSAVQSKSISDLFRIGIGKNLYTFGYGYEGQLGLGDYKNRYNATLVSGIDNPTMVSCGARHTSIIADGQLYAAGAIGTVYWNSPKQGYSKPTVVPQVSGAIFTASGGENNAVIISGQLHMFGSATSNQLRLDTPGGIPTLVLVPGLNNVTFAACGTRHTAVVDSGNLYTFGAGNKGALGLGDLNARNVPTLVPGLKNVSMVSCGAQHTAVIANGRLYTFGSGSSGKLGHGDQKDQLSPKLVEALDNVSFVACGWGHTAAISNGRLYTFGYGSKWALGLFNNEPKFEPILVEDLNNVTMVACGKDHTVAIADGQLYTFGGSDFGQRADSTFGTNYILVPVSNLNNVVFVACGDNHTAAIAD